MKTQQQERLSERAARRKEAFELVKKMEVKYGMKFGKDFFDFLVAMAAINPYYFWPREGTMLWERPYEDSLSESAKRMQEAATRRVEYEYPDFFILVERYKERKDKEKANQQSNS